MILTERMPMLLALLSALAAPAWAQRTPHPCAAMGQPYVVKRCVATEAALMDTVYAAVVKATVAAYPAALRDSAAGVERAWLEQHKRVTEQETEPLLQQSRDLIDKRRRVFRLRHQILVLTAGSDPTRMHAVPVFQEWAPTTQGNHGSALTLTNSTSSTIDVVARLYDPESDQLQERPLRILPHGIVRISWIEGWDWRPGMLLQLLHPQYAPLLREVGVPAER